MEPIMIDTVPYVFAVLRDVDGHYWLFADQADKKIEAGTTIICRFREGHTVR
jgi:hypothetical protein